MITMEKELNGSAPLTAKPTAALIRTVIPMPPGIRVIYTNRQGMVVGMLETFAVSNDGLAAIANDFQAFVAQQTGGVQIAGCVPPGAFS